VRNGTLRTGRSGTGRRPASARLRPGAVAGAMAPAIAAV